MRDRKIELNSEGRPRSSIANLSFFDGGIRVEHRLAADLVDTGIQVTPDVRKHGALQIFVFKKYCAPGVVLFLPGKVLTQCVGIAELSCRIGVERRVRVRFPFFIGR